MIVEDLGTIEYSQAWQYQQQLFDQCLQQKHDKVPTRNVLLFCEHPHTLTMGKNADEKNILFDKEQLAKQGVALFRIDRGGDVTYHGIGQLVAYPIFDLETYNIGLRQYIYNIEEVIIRTLQHYKLIAKRLDGAAGVWLDVDDPRRTRKIAAIGVRSSRFVTMHGLALNINSDLKYFSLINPCGFIDKGVTSMHIELGREIDMQEVKNKMEEVFKSIFNLSV